MKLHDYLRSLDDQGRNAFNERLAALIAARTKRKRKVKTRDVYIDQLASYLRQDKPGKNDRRPSPALAHDIATATEGEVPLWELRADLWPRPPDKSSTQKQKRKAEALAVA
jgi:hypothetical protein